MSNSGRRDFLNPLKAIRAFRDESSEPEVATPSPPLVDSPELDEDALLYVSRPAMACTFQIYFSASAGDETTETAIEALELLEQLENQMTVYRDSPMTYINDVAGSEPTRVEQRLFQLIQKGIELHEKTEGAFDITSGLLSKAWGFFRKQGRVPEQSEIDSVLQNVGSHRIRVNDEEETVFYEAQELEINLGAIGKGHALDRISEFMQQSGMDDFLIHGGQSSVLSRGYRWLSPESDKSSDEPWRVGLRHPLHADKRIAVLKIRDKALGTSGTARQSFYHKGKRYGHIIDPRTGQPATGVYSATALAPTAAEADALATAFYVMGGEAAVKFCRENSEYSCLILSPGKSGDVRIDREGIDDDDLEFTKE